MLLTNIGDTKRFGVFIWKSGKKLRFDFHSNKKNRMTEEPFFACLSQLDRYVSRTCGLKILLLIINWFVHGRKMTHLMLDFIRVEVLRLRINSTLQTIEGGSIAWVMGRFCWRLLFIVFNHIDASKESDYNINVLTSMREKLEEWENVLRMLFTTVLNIASVRQASWNVKLKRRWKWRQWKTAENCSGTQKDYD